MEELKEAFLSGNILVWVGAIVVVVLFVKFLKNAGKLALFLLFVLVAAFAINQYAPQVLTPLVDFVKGGWLGDLKPASP